MRRGNFLRNVDTSARKRSRFSAGAAFRTDDPGAGGGSNVRTLDQLRTFVHDSIGTVLRENPQVLLDAIGGNEVAMREGLTSLGWSVTERSIPAAELVRAYENQVQIGAVDTGFGARHRERAVSVRYEDPMNGGRTRRTFLHSEEVIRLANAWIRAALNKGGTDPQTGRSVAELYLDLEKHAKRDPASPVLGADGSTGVFASAVPTVVAAEVWEIVNMLFPLKGLVQVYVSASPLKIPRRTAKVAVSRGAAATSLSETRPTLDSVSLSPNRVGALSYIDPQLALAAVVGPVRYVLQQLAEAMEEDNQRCILAGVVASSEPEGILELPTAHADSWKNIQLVTYDATSKDTKRAAMRRALYKVPQGHRRRGSFRWVGNTNAIVELSGHNDVDERPWGDEQETYLRRQFVETDQIATVTAIPDTTTVIGGDFSQYAWQESPDGLRLDQTNVGGDAWNTDTIGVRIVQNVDGATVLPNAFVRVNSVVAE